MLTLLCVVHSVKLYVYTWDLAANDYSWTYGLFKRFQSLFIKVGNPGSLHKEASLLTILVSAFPYLYKFC